MNREIKSSDELKAKETMEKMLSIDCALTYLSSKNNIFNVLNKIDDAYISDKKIKRKDEKINYYADKIKIASNLFGMRSLYDGDKNQDILAIVKYIEEQIENIKKEVE